MEGASSLKKECFVFAGVAALLAAGSLVLIRLQETRRLGRPGVRMIGQAVYDETGRQIGTNTIALPPKVLNYTSEVATVSLMEIKGLPGDTTYGRRVYRAPDEFGLVLSVVMMGTDRGSIHKPEYCLAGQGWHPQQMEFLAISIPRDREPPFALPVKKIVASREISTPSGGKQLWRSIYVYWFVAHNEVTASHGQRMWSMSRELLLRGELQRWAYVACWSMCLPGQEEKTFARMRDFISAAVPEFQLVGGNAAVAGISAGALP